MLDKFTPSLSREALIPLSGDDKLRFKNVLNSKPKLLLFESLSLKGICTTFTLFLLMLIDEKFVNICKPILFLKNSKLVCFISKCLILL